MGNEYKCPNGCEQKPKYIGGNTKCWLFLCLHCQQKFEVEDEGFGYLPMRVMIAKEQYP